MWFDSTLLPFFKKIIVRHLKNININFNQIKREVLIEKHQFQTPLLIEKYIDSLFNDVSVDFYEYPSGKTHFLTFANDKFIFGIWNLQQQKFFINFRVVYKELKNILLEFRKNLIKNGAPSNLFRKIDTDLGYILWLKINNYIYYNVKKFMPFGISFTDHNKTFLSISKYRNEEKKYSIFVKQIVISKENDTTRTLHRMKRPNLMKGASEDAVLFFQTYPEYHKSNFEVFFKHSE